MTREEARKLFQPWFDQIDDEHLKQLAERSWQKLPEYFFIKPASSTGKYHPRFANRDGGLVYHTLYALEVWAYLYSGFEDDIHFRYAYQCGIIAVLFHDALKYGDNDANLRYTTKTHPEDAAEWMLTNVNDIISKYILDTSIAYNFKCMCEDYIIKPIEHHQGPWSTHGAPVGTMQRLVFIADYVASQPTFEKELFKCENN